MCGTSQNFFWIFVDELEKQIIITIKKTVKVGQQKQNNFNIYYIAYLKKYKKTPVDIIIKILKICLRYRPKHTGIGNFRSFFHLLPLETPKIKVLNNEKICWRYHRFTHVHHKSRSYDYGPFFALLPPPMDPENHNFEKMKKKLDDIIILQMFAINDSHMIYGFSDMECNRQNFLSFWTVFCPFTPLTTRKIKILKN